MDFVIQGLGLLMAPKVLLVICASSLYGLFVGSIPGLSATLAVSLLIPFTFFMDPVPALVSIVCMSAMAIFAGDIPAALVRIPGTPSSAAYTNDSFALSQQGKAEMVLGVDVAFSAVGGLMGAVVLMTSAPLLADLAMKFSSFEYFWLAALGLSATVMVSVGSQAKGALAMVLGIFLSTIGVDITLGYPRFTFGNVDLLNGISFIPAMIGVFGISEVMRNVMQGQIQYSIPPVRAGNIFKGVGKLFIRYKWNVLRSGALGTFIGVLPGADDDIRAFAEQVHQKFNTRIVAITIRYPDSFEQHRWESAAVHADGTFFRSPAVKSITLCDRLGGGDTWNAGFYYGLLTEDFAADSVVKGVLVGDAATRLKQTLMFDLSIIDKNEVQALMKADLTGGGKRTSR